MIVSIGQKTYQMSKNKYQELLNKESEAVKFGIYCVEKKGQAEMLNIHCKSKSELKQKCRDLKKQGYKVYKNA